MALKKFTAKVSYRDAGGYASSSTYSDGLNATPKDAVMALITEAAWVAARGGFANDAAIRFGEALRSAVEAFEARK